MATLFKKVNQKRDVKPNGNMQGNVFGMKMVADASGKKVLEMQIRKMAPMFRDVIQDMDVKPEGNMQDNVFGMAIAENGLKMEIRKMNPR